VNTSEAEVKEDRSLPTVILSSAIHKGAPIIKIVFGFNANILKSIRSIKEVRWSKTHNCWYAPQNDELLRIIYFAVKDLGRIDHKDIRRELHVADAREEKKRPTPAKTGLPALTDEQQVKVASFEHWMLSRRYSASTISTYTDALKIFLRFYHDKKAEMIDNSDLVAFNNRYILANKHSSSYQNQVVNAVKLFFKTVENKKLQPELIHRPKRARVLPNVLSKEEIKLLLTAQTNIKHQLMLCLIYSCGLRRGELLKMKIRDIDFNRGLIIIRQSKGRKDRIVPLSGKIDLMIRNYFTGYKPREWLFEGQDKAGPYDERSLANVLKQALEKSGIKKPVTLHWLRHSYATHLLESGTDLRYIQEILGHSRSTTTEIYTHVSNNSIQRVISPFDSL
jgi:integrase/recombinase XerD